MAVHFHLSIAPAGPYSLSLRALFLTALLAFPVFVNLVSVRGGVPIVTVDETGTMDDHAQSSLGALWGTWELPDDPWLPDRDRTGREEAYLVTTGQGEYQLRTLWIDRIKPGGSGDPWPVLERFVISPPEARFVTRLELEKGRSVEIEVVAKRVGSPLDPTLLLQNPQGRQFHFVDDSGGLGGDIRHTLTPDMDGLWTLVIQDVEHRSGPDYEGLLRLSDASSPLDTRPLTDAADSNEPSPDSPSPEAWTVASGMPRQTHSILWTEARQNGAGPERLVHLPDKAPMTVTVLTRSLGIPHDVIIGLSGDGGAVEGREKVLGTGDIQWTIRSMDPGHYRLRLGMLTPVPETLLPLAFPVVIDCAWAAFEAGTEKPATCVSMGEPGTIPISITRQNDFRGGVTIRIDPSDPCHQYLALENNLVAEGKDSTDLRIYLRNGEQAGRVVVVRLLACGAGEVGCMPVGTDAALEKAGAGRSARIGQLLRNRILLHFLPDVSP